VENNRKTDHETIQRFRGGYWGMKVKLPQPTGDVAPSNDGQVLGFRVVHDQAESMLNVMGSGNHTASVDRVVRTTAARPSSKTPRLGFRLAFTEGGS
jgi:hypothetical protein